MALTLAFQSPNAPTAFPGLKMWLDGASLKLSNGQPVSSWPDSAGLGATAIQGNPTYQPTLVSTGEYPEVLNATAGGFDLTFPAALAAGETTVFWVGRTSALTTAQWVFNIGAQTWGGRVVNSTYAPVSSAPWNTGLTMPSGTNTQVLAFGGSRAAGFTPVGAGTYTMANGSTAFRVNDNNLGVWPNTAGIKTGFLGGISAGGATPFLGSIRAFLVYDRAMTPGEIRRLSQFLAFRYGTSSFVAPTRQYIFDGDSLTSGTVAGDSKSFPDQITFSGSYRLSNLGTLSQTAGQMIIDATTQVDPLRDTTMTKDIVIAWAGTNDMAGAASASTALSFLKTYCLARKAAGFKVVVLTCLPRQSEGALPGFEAKRQAFNALILGDASFYDALADVGADATIGVAGAQNNATYYNADMIHMTQAGYAIVAGLVQTAIGTL